MRDVACQAARPAPTASMTSVLGGATGRLAERQTPGRRRARKVLLPGPAPVPLHPSNPEFLPLTSRHVVSISTLEQIDRVKPWDVTNSRAMILCGPNNRRRER